MTPTAKHSLCCVLALVLTSLAPGFVGLPAAAQTVVPSDPNVDGGTHPWGSYDGLHENISLMSGNLSFCIPLVSLKGPNKHDLNVPLCYNSQFLEAYTVGSGVSLGDTIPYFPWTWASNTPSGYTTPPMGVGWAFSGAPAYYMAETPFYSSGSTPVWFMPDGAKYSMPNGIGPDTQGADLYAMSANDGPLYTKDGTKFIQTTGSSCPPAGCFEEVFPDSGSAFPITWTNSSITDLIGRTVTVQTSGSGFSGSTKTSSAASIAVQYPDSSGTMRTVTVVMQTMQFTCTANAPGAYTGGPDEVGSGGTQTSSGTYVSSGAIYSMPTAVILPNGLTYTFQYDTCGLLRKVTYPTGGYTRYDYQAEPETLSYDNGLNELTYYENQVVAKHVCPSPAMTLGATGAPSGENCAVLEQTTNDTPTVSYANPLEGDSNTQNVVIDPVGNKVVYQFAVPINFQAAMPAVETSRQYYDASGKLWKTVTTQYSDTTAPGSTFNSGTAFPRVPTVQTTTLDNGMVSQVQWSYDLWNPYGNDSVMTEERVYDYAQGTPGPLIKKTDYTWLHRVNPSAYGWPSFGGNHICDHKASETVYDGSGKELEATTYVYDGNNGGGPGLLSSVRKWRSTDGAWLTTSYQHGWYGNVTQETDPNGNVTNYSYADNYAGGSNPGTNAFLTKTTDPLGHVTQNQYYYGSGLVAATCGENFTGTCATGLTSGADYASYTYDLIGRKTSTTTGDGGQTTNCFSDLGGSGCSAQGYPLQVTSTETIASGVSKVSTSIAMHPINGFPAETSQLNSDPSCPGGTVNVDTTYDADGRKWTVTNPYCSSNPNASTSGTTTYAYDGLSRVIQVTHPDNTSANNTYTGRAVLSADEGNGAHNVSRISQTDALGRLIYVCEVTSQEQQGASNNTPSSCNLDVSGTGFLTTYGYDASNSNGPLESLTSVIQGGISRSFVYDSLGELRSAYNPESGTTTYSYDNDGNLISKTSPLENQQTGTVTTTYVYDHLNRLTGKSYSDGTTPTACFEYDSTSGNGTGRLTTEWTQASGACSATPPGSGVLTQRTFAAYDPLGRVSTDEQCATLGNCSSVYALNYGYDLAGDMTSFNNGLAGSSTQLAFTGQYNSAGRLSAVNGSAAPGGQSTPLFIGTGYTPAGALANALLGSGLNFHRDYNSRLLPIDEVDTTGTAPANATVQITGSEQKMTVSTGSISFSGAEQCSGSNCDGGLFIVQIGSGPYIQIIYGQNSTAASLASALAGVLVCGSQPVSGVASGNTVNLTSCTSGANTNYTINAYASAHSPSFAQYSFSIIAAGANVSSKSFTFTGAEQSEVVNGQTIYDSGIFYLYNEGASSPPLDIFYNQTSTPSTLAQAVVQGLPPCSTSGELFSATASGPTVTLSPCQAGSNVSLDSLLDWHSSQFSTPSFYVGGTGTTVMMNNLTNPTSVWDAGQVALLVNGEQVAMTTYGQSSTPATIASALASNVSSGSAVKVTANGANITVTSLDDGTQSDYSYALQVTSSVPQFSSSPSFTSSPGSGSLTGGTNAPLYNWAINSYAPNGDVLGMTDYVMGTWSYNYDDFNRLTSGAATAGVDNGLTLGWTYDRYGNRWAQNATGSGNASAVQPQLSFTGNTNHVDGWSYDDAGNLLNDGRNNYAYDAEGRIVSLNGQPTYLYDAEGRRVAKYSGSTISAMYLLDLAGNQVTELNGSGTWMHSNVWAGGRLLATYEGPGESKPNTWHFHLTDWLGTQRMQTNAAGQEEEMCYSYPFGDGLTCTGSAADSTEHHFTAKERDTESGLDYFYARYYSSDLARFMTPDWAAKPTAVPYAEFGDPQSLDLYRYVRSNPMRETDQDGHCEPFCGWLVGAAVDFVVSHPKIGDAVEKVFNSSSVKVGIGAGVGVKLGPVQLSANADSFVKTPAMNDTQPTQGMEARVGASGGIAGISGGGEVTKQGQEPATADASIDATVAGVTSTVVGTDPNGGETSLSLGAYDGVGGEIDFSTSTSALEELGGAVVDAVQDEVGDALQSVSTTAEQIEATNGCGTAASCGGSAQAASTPPTPQN